MTEHKTSTLDDMCEFIIDCPHFTPEWTDSGYIVVRNQNIRDGRLNLSEPSYTHRADFERRIRRAKPRAGDIIFTREAPMGEVCVIPDNLECCIGQRQVLLRPKSSIDGRYLFFALRCNYVRHQIFWNEGSGSTVSNVRIPVLKALKIPRLGVDEKVIGELLGAFDDKLALNRQMNETLEAMVRAIFKDWFIDFGPTRAKMDGRAPYLAPYLWSPFPDRLNADCMPEGWNVRDLSVLTSELRRGISPSYMVEGGVRVINQKCIRNGMVDFMPARRHDPVARSVDGRELNIGDILVNSTGVGTLGRTAQIRHLDETTVVDSHVTVVRADQSQISPLYLGVDLTGREHEIEALGEGSTGQTELARARLGALPILVPTKHVQVSFDSTVGPLSQLMTLISQENITLAQTRDLLLPKLMSGEIRLKDAEKVVEDAL